MQNTRPAKTALIKEFGKDRVISVRRGKGTACGWIEAAIEIDKPLECSCTNYEYCSKCREAMRNADKKATQIIKTSGLELSTYCDDMNMGDHDCILVSVHFSK